VSSFPFSTPYSSACHPPLLAFSSSFSSSLSSLLPYRSHAVPTTLLVRVRRNVPLKGRPVLHHFHGGRQPVAPHTFVLRVIYRCTLRHSPIITPRCPPFYLRFQLLPRSPFLTGAATTRRVYPFLTDARLHLFIPPCSKHHCSTPLHSPFAPTIISSRCPPFYPRFQLLPWSPFLTGAAMTRRVYPFLTDARLHIFIPPCSKHHCSTPLHSSPQLLYPQGAHPSIFVSSCYRGPRFLRERLRLDVFIRFLRTLVSISSSLHAQSTSPIPLLNLLTVPPQWKTRCFLYRDTKSLVSYIYLIIIVATLTFILALQRSLLWGTRNRNIGSTLCCHSRRQKNSCSRRCDL
jgi:hypothetical protein